ncbi:MAG: cysteine desulfurase [Lachnospiraceae bacterium]|nr:cysteine desulfurase [Lachnospiraceae bacterium]
MAEIYLDNSATTRVYPEVASLIEKIMEEDYGNAASLHRKGMEAERYVKHAKEQIASTLRVDPKNIFFTSGGTESNNWAITGAALANRRAGMKIVTTVVEHPSVRNVVRFLEDFGFSAVYLPVDRDGVVRLEDLKEAVTPDTILVSVMFVNNEIGSVQPVGEIGAWLKKNRPDTLLHVDAIQAYGKYEIRPKKLGIDLMSVSGHKLHGPKGVGFLYVADHVKIKPLLYGGGQQKGMRSGTENVPGEAGMGLAAEIMYKNLPANVSSMYARKQRLTEGLEQIEGAHVNGKKGQDSAPHIVSCSFDGVRSEVLLHALEAKHIYVSSGSACASSHPSEITTLLAIGLKKEEQEGTIRFSLSEWTTDEEIDETLSALKELLPQLRKFTRK